MFLRHLGRSAALSLALIAAAPAVAANDWVFTGGSADIDMPDDLATNMPGQPGIPGARTAPAQWIDLNGDLWLYSGSAPGLNNVRHNQLWRYQTSLNTWILVSANPNPNGNSVYPTNVGEAGYPAPRYGAACWLDDRGNLYMFGGFGGGRVTDVQLGRGRLNDLWRYEIGNQQWIWAGGTQYVYDDGEYNGIGDVGWPAARSNAAVTVIDNTFLYLYGGTSGTGGNSGEYLQDLWSLNITQAPNFQWVLLSGDDTRHVVPTYPDKPNEPGGSPASRSGALIWPSRNGDSVWLFGGAIPRTTPSPTYTNDLWKFHRSTREWRCHHLTSTPNFPSGYGQFGIPRRRSDAAIWLTSNDVQIFGGVGLHGTSTARFNDFWHFDETQVAWKWMDGSSEQDPDPVYPGYGGNGTPKPRHSPAYWYAPTTEKLYMLGGGASASTHRNDFWVRDTEPVSSSVNDWQLWD